MKKADKSAESWIDDDAIAFEMKLADLVRRFKNLEALQKEVAANGEGFEARRITLTKQGKRKKKSSGPKPLNLFME
ncbi:hypothetical protein VB735_28725 [Halotia wernerae UHCC 0503]|nr:hypothetical protein [Halotia wernerae UHCC 0503]